MSLIKMLCYAMMSHVDFWANDVFDFTNYYSYC